GLDQLNVIGGAADSTLAVTLSVAGAITKVANSTVQNIESVTADLDGGTDTLSYAGATQAVSVDFTAGTATGFTSVRNIENATGGSGNDTLVGAAGVINTLAGGLGNDTYVVHDTGDVVTEAANGGLDEVRSVAAAYTLGANVENLTLIGSGNYTGTGN